MDRPDDPTQQSLETKEDIKGKRRVASKTRRGVKQKIFRWHPSVFHLLRQQPTNTVWELYFPGPFYPHLRSSENHAVLGAGLYHHP